MMTSIKSILNDSNLDLTFAGSKYANLKADHESVVNRLTKLKVRLRSVFDSLLRLVSDQERPLPNFLVSFVFKYLICNGSYFPETVHQRLLLNVDRARLPTYLLRSERVRARSCPRSRSCLTC